MEEGSKSVTYFSANVVPFPEVINSKIKTKEFLNASKNVVGLLDLLGKSFAPARYDMSGNIEKISKKYNENCVEYEYVEDMLLDEKRAGNSFAIEALMWLRRGLHFLLEFFENIANDAAKQEDLSSMLTLAYSHTLKKYHGWIGSNLFCLLSKVVPYRKGLFQCMALNKENCDDAVLEDLIEFNANLRPCVEHLSLFYMQHCLETNVKI